MIADVNEDNIVVHLDTLHMNIEETSLDRACRLCGSKLGYGSLAVSLLCWHPYSCCLWRRCSHTVQAVAAVKSRAHEHRGCAGMCMQGSRTGAAWALAL